MSEPDDKVSGYISLLEQELCRTAIHALRLSAEIGSLKRELAEARKNPSQANETETVIETYEDGVKV